MHTSFTSLVYSTVTALDCHPNWRQACGMLVLGSSDTGQATEVCEAQVAKLSVLSMDSGSEQLCSVSGVYIACLSAFCMKRQAWPMHTQSLRHRLVQRQATKIL